MLDDYPSWTIAELPTFCVAPGCVHKTTDDAAGPRFAVEGTDLCNWHHARFPRILKDLADLWPELERALYKNTGAVSNTRVQKSGITDLAQSWNPHVTEVMADLADWTMFMVRTVLRERPLPTTFVHDDDVGRSVTEYVRGLHADTRPRVALIALALHDARWLSGYPSLGPAFLADAIEHRFTVQRALGSESVRRVGLKGAVCGEVVVDDELLGELTCMAPMVAILTPEDRPSSLRCSVHPKTHRAYRPDEWMSWAR